VELRPELTAAVQATVRVTPVTFVSAQPVTGV